MKILVINGPNINLLGTREPEIYGNVTYKELCEMIEGAAERLDVQVGFYQSNHEGAIVDAIQGCRGVCDGIIINPAAYTHTSIAIPDAIRAVDLPAVEVHISDPDTREDFRKISYIRPVCIAAVKGHGVAGYLEALRILHSHLRV